VSKCHTNTLLRWHFWIIVEACFHYKNCFYSATKQVRTKWKIATTARRSTLTNHANFHAGVTLFWKRLCAPCDEIWTAFIGIARSKRNGTRAETRFGLSAKRTSPFKSAGVSVQSTTGSRGVRISGQRLYRPCSDVQRKAAGYPLHSHFSPSLPLPCVTVCHQVPNALYESSCLSAAAAGNLIPYDHYNFSLVKCNYSHAVTK